MCLTGNASLLMRYWKCTRGCKLCFQECWLQKQEAAYPCNKEWRDRRDEFKKKVSRCVRRSQEMF
ncbi:unnamed protein product, partial [Vitis vinifera]